MAEEEKKKKLSVAEILAAARQADAKGDAPPPAAKKPKQEAPASAAETDGDNDDAPAREAPPLAAKSAAAAGGRPSVADILAAARANKGAAPAPAAETKVAKPQAKPTAKPVVKATEKPAGKATATTTLARETSSILTGGQAAKKPGPVTKLEAAARGKPTPAAPAKAKGLEVPAMPVKPDYARPKPAKAAAPEEDRRGFLMFLLGSAMGLGFTSMAATFGLWTFGTARFMFPNILTEPPSKFKVGFPGEFAPGQVETKFVSQFGVWVVNAEYQDQREVFALRTVCTHLGCTPNWLEAEQKFKCPCHGSGFYKNGINFEGPAPRPLERYAVRIAEDGQLEVDKSRLFQEELGQWNDPASFVPV